VGAIGEGAGDGTRVAVGTGVTLVAGLPDGVGRGVGGGNGGVTSTVGPASGFGSAPVADAWKTMGQFPVGSRELPLYRPSVGVPEMRGSETVRFATDATTELAGFEPV